VTDNGVKGRVKGLLGGPPPMNGIFDQMDAPSEATAQHQALQVLTLAQRTAEEHLASARRESDRICADARAKAEQIVRDAQAHAHGLAQDAEKALSDAHATAAQIARDAQAHSDNAQRNAEGILSEARTRADELAKNAQANADELKHQAQQRYEDVVGSLATKREGLQQQIEALEQFEREYRARLTTFMQNQLRALWVDEPQVGAEDLEQPVAALPGQRSNPDQ
jgi:cell division septum initiation protein DivIVA